MKKVSRLSFALKSCAFILVFIIFCGSAFAEFKAKVTSSKLVVRSGPTVSDTYLGSLSKGTIVTVHSYSDGIAYIEYNGRYGYALVSGLAKVTQTETTDSTLPSWAVKSDDPSTAYVSVSKMIVRSGPSTSYKQIGTLKKGVEFNVHATNDGIAYIEYKGNFGFAAEAHFKLKSEETSAAEEAAVIDETLSVACVVNTSCSVYKYASTASTKLTTFSKGYEVTLLGTSNNWALISRGSAKGYISLDALTKISDITLTAAGSVTAVTSASAKFYKYAADYSTYLGTLSAGKSVTVLNKNSSWALVSYNGNTGYCKANLLNYEQQTEEKEENPVIEETVSIQAILKTGATVYKYADNSSTALKTLSAGTVVTVLGYNSSWALIKSDGETGYAALSSLEKLSNVTIDSSNPLNISAAVNVSSLKFYQYACTYSKYLGTLSYGSSVTIKAVNDSWALVEKSGKYGYCALASLKVNEATPELEETESIESLMITASAVYKYASETSDKLGTVSKNTCVTVLAHNDTWALIELNGKKGYTSTSALKPLSSLVLKETESYSATVTKKGYAYKYMTTASTKAGTVNLGLEVTVLAHDDSWALIKCGSNKGYFPVSSLKIRIDEFTDPTVASLDATAVTSATVYDCALVSGNVLGSYSVGDSVSVTAYTSKWAQVKYGSKTGYVLKKYLSASNYTELKSGNDSGSDVLKLQNALEDLGYFDGIPAGNFGTLTQAAIKRLQKQLGFEETGTASTALLRIIYSGYAPASPIKSASLVLKSKGDDVTRLQTRLTYKGYMSASIDGDYGSITQSAVKLYQKVAGLEETGDADSKTLSSLFSSSAPKNTGSAVTSGTTTSSSGTGKYSTNADDDTLTGTASEKIEKVIECALNQLGKPYIYATSGPNSYDCSGLTLYCYKQVGVSLGRSAYAVGYGKGEKIEGINNLKRGDIVCMNTISDSDLSDHVGIYLGNYKFVHASSAAAKVVISSLASGSYYNKVFSWGRRVL